MLTFHYPNDDLRHIAIAHLLRQQQHTPLPQQRLNASQSPKFHTVAAESSR